MSDDSFIREVDEEMRQDQLRNLWSRFGNYLIAVAVLVVLVTAGYRGWEYYTTKRAAESGDRFLSAVELADEANHEQALEMLNALSEDGAGQYPQLARLRIAGELARQGKPQEAIEAFDKVADDGSVNEILRDIARLRAGLLAVDLVSYEEVSARLEPLAAGGEPHRALAREGLGLAALKAGDPQMAEKWFSQIAEDSAAGAGVKGRASVMLELLAGRGVGAGN